MDIISKIHLTSRADVIDGKECNINFERPALYTHDPLSVSCMNCLETIPDHLAFENDQAAILYVLIAKTFESTTKSLSKEEILKVVADVYNAYEEQKGLDGN